MPYLRNASRIDLVSLGNYSLILHALYGVCLPSIGYSIAEHQCVFALQKVLH